MKASQSVYLGFDLGASSGRAMLGLLEDGRLRLQEVNRFHNAPCRLQNRVFWNFLGLWSHVLASLRMCAVGGHRLTGIGVDTWGVDFGLLGEDGSLLGNPMCYRDPIIEGMDQTIAREIAPSELYRITGWPPTRVSTLSELVALNRNGSVGTLKNAATILLMPDLFRYFLCGQRAVELTAAGSGQAADLHRGTWCTQVFEKLGLPTKFLPEIIKPGRSAGLLSEEIASAAGLNQAPVIAVAGHDTASATAAAPLLDDEYLLISCGTWSVVGVVQDAPITSAEARTRGFVNEIGLESILFVKNSMGLRLLENLRRTLIARGQRTTWAKMIDDARQVPPLTCFLAVDAPQFFFAPDTEASAREFLRRTGQNASCDVSVLTRAILEGLAWHYRITIADLTFLTGKELKRICLVGGGSRNGLLCQMVADATGREVIAGPAEATAAGNLATQALATGRLDSPADIRRLIRRSFRLKTYRPQATSLWDKNFDRYLAILNQSQSLDSPN